jgi:hypothetical protein
VGALVGENSVIYGGGGVIGGAVGKMPLLAAAPTMRSRLP